MSLLLGVALWDVALVSMHILNGTPCISRPCWFTNVSLFGAIAAVHHRFIGYILYIFNALTAFDCIYCNWLHCFNCLSATLFSSHVRGTQVEHSAINNVQNLQLLATAKHSIRHQNQLSGTLSFTVVRSFNHAFTDVMHFKTWRQQWVRHVHYTKHNPFHICTPTILSAMRATLLLLLLFSMSYQTVFYSRQGCIMVCGRYATARRVKASCVRQCYGAYIMVCSVYVCQLT